MNKKGFTLVELLAVIAILAILVIMAVPAVIKIFNKSRIDTFNNELNTIIKAAQHQYVLDGEATTYSNSSNPLRVTSNSDFNYCITVNAEGDIINFKATNGSYKYESDGIVEETGSSDITEISGEFSLQCGPIKYVNRQNEGQITVGDEIAIDTEHFYVVSSDSTNTVLLAKYNLYVGDIIQKINITKLSYVKTLSHSDSGYGLQNPSAVAYKPDSSAQLVGMISFSGTNYWDSSTCQYTNTTLGCSGTSSLLNEYAAGGASYSARPYPYVYKNSMSNIEPEIVYGENGTSNGYGFAQNNGYTIAYYIKDYANKLKNLGAPSSLVARLLSFEEIISLGCSASSLNCSRIKSWVNNTSFWMGNAYNDSKLWVWQVGDAQSQSSLNQYWFGYISGVRPVIVIPTSSMPS